jgi:diguanylate cyclase (GGDEF)-like protein/PAS domain S-box-containing protein
MALPRSSTMNPFAAGGRGTLAAILLTFTLVAATSVWLSISATARSHHRGAVLEVAARQRTLAERYLEELLRARAGRDADPEAIATALRASAHALVNGGTAPAINGDDDEAKLAPPEGNGVRAQLKQQEKLVADLTTLGSTWLAHRSLADVRETAGEHLAHLRPIARISALTALTSNVGLNAARTFAKRDDQTVSQSIMIEIAVGAGGLLISLLLGWALIAATRRRTAHFRTLVSSSTDLVIVYGAGGCRYVSDSVVNMLGRSEADLLEGGFLDSVHPDDRAVFEAASDHANCALMRFRLSAADSEWRHVEAHLTDLRNDRRIGGVLLNARDVTERVRLEGELEHRAFHDSLTGIANRALFGDRLEQALARSARSVDGIALLMIDLDGFKQVNDSLGHKLGDELLQEVARRLAACTRPSDTTARLGGDEFAILAEALSEQEAVTLAHRILAELETPISAGGRDVAIGASIGIVAHVGAAGERESLMRRADLAVYSAKDRGRGRVEVFRSEMEDKHGELLELEQELRLGLERDEFALHYQPEVAIDGSSIVGVEALLRWRSPTRGLVPPARFIPLAERTGLILPLGEFVLREACHQAARWRRELSLTEPFVMWVNVSAKQLSAGGITALVRQSLDDAGLRAGWLGLEVTESAVVEDNAAADRARVELQELRDLGVRVAIDDFGTGFSSLGQLRTFPVDVIKVDRSFVQDVDHNARDAAITANLVSLAHALGLVAVAEGIESVSQLDSLRRLGCDLAQGYLFARPAPPEQIAPLLRAPQLALHPSGTGSAVA